VLSVIEPTRGWGLPDLQEAWRYRDVLYCLVARDFKVRFKQTLLGGLWVLIRPVAAIMILTVVFGRVVKIPSDGVPYSVFVLSGLLPWNYFSGSLSAGSGSLVSSANLITKVSFPRLIIPATAMVSGLVDLGVSLSLLIGLIVWHGLALHFTLLLTVPLLIFLLITFTFAVSLWLSALNVRYRDVNNLVPFLVQLWMYATPVVYPLRIVPARFRLVAMLNPVTGIVEGIRSVLFGRPIPWTALSISIAATAVLCLGGLVFFRFQARSFADTV
jgi:lipopolysaccharide transport system permease protein